MEVINTETGLLGSREGHEVCSKFSRQEKANTPFDLQSFEHDIFKSLSMFSSVQFSSVVQSCPTLCNPMNCRTPGLPVHHHLSEFTQTHVHWVSDVIHPSHPLSSPSPPAPNPSQHQSLFQWVNSSHEVAKVLEFRLQHYFSSNTQKIYTITGH